MWGVWSIFRYIYIYFFFRGVTAHRGPGCLYCHGFATILRHTSFSRNPLDEWSARRRDLYLTSNNKRKRMTFMTPAGFETAIPWSELPQASPLRPRDWWDRSMKYIVGIKHCIVGNNGNKRNHIETFLKFVTSLTTVSYRYWWKQSKRYVGIRVKKI